MSDVPVELLSAIRQFRHNSDDELVFGYDKKETNRQFAVLKTKVDNLRLKGLSHSHGPWFDESPFLTDEYKAKLMQIPIKDRKKFLEGEWLPDERMIALEKRLDEYYEATPDEVPNRIALEHWKGLNAWVKLNGYSQTEFDRAKKNRCP